MMLAAVGLCQPWEVVLWAGRLTKLPTYVASGEAGYARELPPSEWFIAFNSLDHE
jgi:hypothetical protein